MVHGPNQWIRLKVIESTLFIIPVHPISSFIGNIAHMANQGGVVPNLNRGM